MGGGYKKEVTYVYLWPIHVDVWQNPSQYCNYPTIKKYTPTPFFGLSLFHRGKADPWVTGPGIAVGDNSCRRKRPYGSKKWFSAFSLVESSIKKKFLLRLSGWIRL